MFKVLQCPSKLMKVLSECQTALILVRGLVTQRLIRIQAVCLWHLGCALQVIGYRLAVINGSHSIQFIFNIALTLSVQEPHLCLCKQVGSRPAAEQLGGWPEIQPVCYSVSHFP